MSHIFYILNRSDVESTKITGFREELRKELLRWGYCSSEKLEESNEYDVLLKDGFNIDSTSEENASVIIISSGNIPDINTPIVKAEDIFGVSCQVDAVLFTGGNIQERYKGYQYNQFSPALMMFGFNNLNLTEIVAFLINKNSYIG